MRRDMYDRELLLLSSKDILKENVKFSQGDILQDVDNMPAKNTVLLCRNFWPYLDSLKRKELLQKLENKFDESSLIVIGSYDVEDCSLDMLLMSHQFLPTSVRNVFQKCNVHQERIINVGLDNSSQVSTSTLLDKIRKIPKNSPIVVDKPIDNKKLNVKPY